MPEIVEMIDTILCDVENETLIENTRKKVNDMMQNRPLFAWQYLLYNIFLDDKTQVDAKLH